MNIYRLSSSYYSQDNNPITKIKQDNYHKYQVVDGIKYELSGGNEQITNIENVENTEGNSFYDDHIDKYVNYLNNGGIIHSFPVQTITGLQSIDEMVRDLEESSRGDMYEAPYWKFQDKYKISYQELDELIELYNDKDYFDEDDENEKIQLDKIERFTKMVKSFYEDEVEEVYSLTDHNHRFEAVRKMGVKSVMVDID